jgi:hypothetical protein
VTIHDFQQDQLPTKLKQLQLIVRQKYHFNYTLGICAVQMARPSRWPGSSFASLQPFALMLSPILPLKHYSIVYLYYNQNHYMATTNSIIP